LYLLAALLIFTTILGCAAESVPTIPRVATATASGASGPQVRCQAGCIDIDSFPSSPGAFISYTVTGPECFDEGGHTDADLDGLSDFCEKNLAEAFAPELALAYANVDPATREPRWVARPAGSNRVLIAYLLGYHLDYGSANAICDFEIGGLIEGCQGHPGDSESIGMLVKYDSGSHHWVLEYLYLSQHDTYQTIASGTKGYPAVTYPNEKGGRPRVFVATGKHANYATVSECDSGGQFGVDSCSPDRFEVVRTGEPYNLGSEAVKFVNCVASDHPVYSQYGYSECYWTAPKFAGWTGAEPASDGNRSRLIYFGFLGN